MFQDGTILMPASRVTFASVAPRPGGVDDERALDAVSDGDMIGEVDVAGCVHEVEDIGVCRPGPYS